MKERNRARPAARTAGSLLVISAPGVRPAMVIGRSPVSAKAAAIGAAGVSGSSGGSTTLRYPSCRKARKADPSPGWLVSGTTTLRWQATSSSGGSTAMSELRKRKALLEHRVTVLHRDDGAIDDPRFIGGEECHNVSDLLGFGELVS